MLFFHHATLVGFWVNLNIGYDGLCLPVAKLEM